MSRKQTLHNVLKKNWNKQEAVQDIGAFAALEGDDGDRVLEHLARVFEVYETSRNKNAFQAGYDEGVKAIFFYLETMRTTYGETLERIND
jgi:hypothetical protein